MSNLALLPKDIVNLVTQHWIKTEHHPARLLLRLVALRDLRRLLHGEQSKALAHQARREALSIKKLTEQIDRLRLANDLDAPLPVLLSEDFQAKPQTRVIPDGLAKTIARSKLERYDRLWETQIAIEAFAQGWSFWILSARVQVTRAEAWHNALEERLWPEGAILFVETSRAQKQAAGQSSWQGDWYLILSPSFPKPETFTPSLLELPGLYSIPTGPSWTPLHQGRGF